MINKDEQTIPTNYTPEIFYNVLFSEKNFFLH